MHTLILEYLISKTWIHVFGISTRFDGVRATSCRLDPNNPMPRAESSLRRVDGAASFAEVEERWRDWDFLIAMVEAWCEEGDLIYLSPHGSLHGLPLHLLRIAGRTLLERNVVAYSPGLSILRLCRHRSRALATTVSRKVAVFGDSRTNLPETSTEAVEVARLLGTQPILGEGVTQEVVEASVADAAIVHFAGHGVLGAHDPLDAGLALADGQTLTARRIFEIGNFGRGLVVLSGCETGVDEVRKGDELIGLTRALLYGGASTVVVSLWRVDDSATAFFMRQFYAIIQASPTTSKAKALQEAALKTRAVKEWKSPFFWGAFILVGDYS